MNIFIIVFVFWDRDGGIVKDRSVLWWEKWRRIGKSCLVEERCRGVDFFYFNVKFLES